MSYIRDPASPQERDIRVKLRPFEDSVPTSYTVNDDNDLVAAADLLQDVVKRKKELDELRKNITRPMDEAKKKVMDLFRPVETGLANAEMGLKRAIGTYQDRKALDAAKQEYLLRVEYDKQRALIEQEAHLLADDGDIEQANELLATVPSVPVVMTTKVNAPVSTRTTWKAQGPTNKTEMLDFVSWVAANDMWNLISVNQSALDAFARSTRGITKVPGVNFYQERTVVAR